MLSMGKSTLDVNSSKTIIINSHSTRPTYAPTGIELQRTTGTVNLNSYDPRGISINDPGRGISYQPPRGPSYFGNANTNVPSMNAKISF